MKISNAILRFGQRFLQEQEGSVLIMFGLGATLLFAVGGAGVDLGQQQLTKLRIQQSADAAAISAAAITTSSYVPTITPSDRINAGYRYFNLNWPENSELPEEISVRILGNSIRVGAESTSSTAFLDNGTLSAQGASTVGINTQLPSDYDLVVTVDEAASTGTMMANPNVSHPGEHTRMGVIKSSILTLLDSVLPPDNSNPNVRFGLTGYTDHYISNKWPLTSNRTDAAQYVTHLETRTSGSWTQGVWGGVWMILGGGEIWHSPPDSTYACDTSGDPECENTTLPVGSGFGCSISCNSGTGGFAGSYGNMPATATMRTNPSYHGANPSMPNADRSNTRSLVIIPAGPIDPASCAAINQYYALVYVINIGITDTSTVANFRACASIDPLTHQPRYYEAPDEPALRGIFNNISQTLRSIHITS